MFLFYVILNKPLSEVKLLWPVLKRKYNFFHILKQNVFVIINEDVFVKRMLIPKMVKIPKTNILILVERSRHKK